MQLAIEGWDANTGRVDARLTERNYRQCVQEIEKSRAHNYYLALIALPNFLRVKQEAAKSQSMVNQAWITCVLERYRAALGQYPPTLEALKPEFAAKLPLDI